MLWALAGSPSCTKSDSAPAKDEGGSKASLEADDGTPAAAAEATPALPEAQGVLDRATEAMGGKAAIARVQSFHYRGTIDMVGHNIHGDLEIWWEAGDFYMEQKVPGIGTMRAGKRGDEIWAEDPIHGRRRLFGVEAEQHAWASSVLLAAEWKRYFERAQTVAERTVDGKRIYDVRLESGSGLEVVMSFDAESGLQVGQGFEQVTPMGKQPFEVRFEDYRDVDGIKLAYRQVIDAKIQQVVQEITEVEINPAIDESRFAMPRGEGVDVVVAPDAPPEDAPENGAEPGPS